MCNRWQSKQEPWEPKFAGELGIVAFAICSVHAVCRLWIRRSACCYYYHYYSKRRMLRIKRAKITDCEWYPAILAPMQCDNYGIIVSNIQGDMVIVRPCQNGG